MMTKDECATFGIEEAQRFSYMRRDNAKANFAPVSGSAE